MTRIEYVWLSPNPHGMLKLRSKVRYFHGLNDFNIENQIRSGQLDWSFDGSSTDQATGKNSDLILIPATYYTNTLDGGYLVLCEVHNSKGPHYTNTRYKLLDLLKSNEKIINSEPLVGFEQEYVLWDKHTKLPLGFNRSFSDIKPQGDYYCGVGSDNVAGREIVEQHAEACLKAGINLYGTNAEVLLGQWEFQIGPRPGDSNLDFLKLCDDLWMARYLLSKIAEKYKLVVNYDPKPLAGDWNGSGCHTNFSTEATRAEGGLEVIKGMIEKLSKKHQEHIEVYGIGNERRLTGLHETCDINTFKSGNSDRGSSIRIPINVVEEGKGYFEDRRPAANCDPYEVVLRILKTLFDL